MSFHPTEMFVKKDIVWNIINVLVTESTPNSDTLTQKIMDELTIYQRSIAKEESVKGGRPQKNINLDTVKKQLSAGVPFTAIAASQKVREGTLRRRIKGGGIISLNKKYF
jgi:hypothetical protein